MQDSSDRGLAPGRNHRRWPRPVYIADGSRKLDDFIRLTDREILTHSGLTSHNAAVARAEAELVKYREA